MPTPYREVDLGDATLPLWVVRFDERGVCVDPRARRSLVTEVAGGGYTDVFVFSHGWNNTFERATDRYERFLAGYHLLAQTHGLAHPSPYKPLLVGIYWPSIDLILPWERAPQIAAATTPGQTGSDAAERAELTSVAQEALDPGPATELGRLAAQTALTDGEARELARLLAGAFPSEDELGPGNGRPTTDDIMATWHALADLGRTERSAEPAGPASFRVAPEDDQATAPDAAGIVSRLDPRDILRAFTVYKMKDRAGLVGAVGGASLLRDLLAADDRPRFHLVGHSFGCRLLLAAICAEPLPRSIDSLLLLQAAVNYLCFARQVPKLGKPGGFRVALDRVDQPILSTFSAHDRALHDFFHLAVRRHSDLGEMQVAGLGEVPSIYSALGGWGPGGLDPDEASEVSLAAFPERYALEDVATRVYALNGGTGITSHSDVVNDWTYWALYNQVSRRS